MAAHQAPPSLGFSRQEHWSGLPFPSPMHESEKWKWSLLVMSNSSWPHGLQPTRLLRPWDFPGKSTGVGCHCLLCSLSLHSFNPSFRELEYASPCWQQAEVWVWSQVWELRSYMLSSMANICMYIYIIYIYDIYIYIYEIICLKYGF